MTDPAAAARLPSSRRPLRSLGAVLAGLLADIVVVGVIDAAFRAAGVYPPMFQPMAEHLWGLALLYRVIAAVAAGYLTARLAPPIPGRPVWLALVLGGIQTAMSLAFVLSNWDKPDFGPHWFGIIAVVSCLPCAALGGLLHARQGARVNRQMPRNRQIEPSFTDCSSTSEKEAP